MNHRNRSVCFLLLLATIVVHLTGQAGPVAGSPLIYSLLGLQFLVSPHLMYWHARRSSEPVRAELVNLLFDTVSLGVWTGVLGFPLWLGFGMFIGTAVNLAAFRGVLGPPMAIAGFAAGATLGAALGGWHFAPQTSVTVTLMAVLSTSAHLLIVALNVYRRSALLQEAQSALREREAALSGRITEIQALQTQLRQEANRDALTGLYNRRYLESTLPREWARCLRARRPITVLLLDVDRFQGIQDTHGQQGGDSVLKALGATLARMARTADVACRYGDQAFFVLFPDMPLANARQRAERLRSEVEAMRIPFAGSAISFTVSLGLAVWPDHADQPESLIGLADAALHRARRDGQNRVVVSDAARGHEVRAST